MHTIRFLRDMLRRLFRKYPDPSTVWCVTGTLGGATHNSVVIANTEVEARTHAMRYMQVEGAVSQRTLADLIAFTRESVHLYLDGTTS
jgi:hypothetical protein